MAGTGFAHFDRRNAGLLCLQISMGFSQDIIQGTDTLMKCSDRLRDTEVTWKQAGSRYIFDWGRMAGWSQHQYSTLTYQYLPLFTSIKQNFKTHHITFLSSVCFNTKTCTSFKSLSTFQISLMSLRPTFFYFFYHPSKAET